MTHKPRDERIWTCYEGSPRAFGPGLWPGPRRQARWVGRGRRRGRPGQYAAFWPGICDILPGICTLGAALTAWPWCWRARQRDTAETAGGRSPGCGARQPPRRRACVRRTRRKLPPRNGETLGEPRPPTAGHPGRSSLSTVCARPRCSRPRPSGPPRRRCALEDVVQKDDMHRLRPLAAEQVQGHPPSGGRPPQLRRVKMDAGSIHVVPGAGRCGASAGA